MRAPPPSSTECNANNTIAFHYCGLVSIFEYFHSLKQGFKFITVNAGLGVLRHIGAEYFELDSVSNA